MAFPPRPSLRDAAAAAGVDIPSSPQVPSVSGAIPGGMGSIAKVVLPKLNVPAIPKLPAIPNPLAQLPSPGSLAPGEFPSLDGKICALKSQTPFAIQKAG